MIPVWIRLILFKVIVKIVIEIVEILVFVIERVDAFEVIVAAGVGIVIAGVITGDHGAWQEASGSGAAQREAWGGNRAQRAK